MRSRSKIPLFEILKMKRRLSSDLILRSSASKLISNSSCATSRNSPSAAFVHESEVLQTQRHISKSRYSRAVLQKLFDWLVINAKHPFPSLTQKQRLMHLTSLDYEQVNGWFINARRRYLKNGVLVVDVNKFIDCQ